MLPKTRLIFSGFFAVGACPYACVCSNSIASAEIRHIALMRTNNRFLTYILAVLPLTLMMGTKTEPIFPSNSADILTPA